MKLYGALVACCLLYAALPASRLHAAAPLADLLAHRMQALRSGTTVDVDDDALLAEEPQTLLQATAHYEHDSQPIVRWSAYTLEFQAAMKSADAAVRQDVVTRLLAACADPEPLVWQHAGEQLRSFVATDFTAAAKQLIKTLVTKDAAFDWLLLAGVAQISELQPQLKSIVASQVPGTVPPVGKWYGTPAWAARLALARMGDKEQLLQAIAAVEQEPEAIARVTVLLGHLAYTRQPEAVAVLKTYLDSDERLPSVKASDKGIGSNQYALDLLAQIIVGFPTASTGPGYAPEVVASCREWMNKQTGYTIIK